MNSFAVGQEHSLTLDITPEMVEKFVIWSGDNAPLHTSNEFAQTHNFKGKIVHGAALISLASQFVGVSFPGPNSLWLKADVKFHKPCYAPTELTIHGKILMLSQATSSLIIEINMYDSDKNHLLSIKSFHKILATGKTDEE